MSLLKNESLDIFELEICFFFVANNRPFPPRGFLMTRPTDPIELYAWLKQEVSKLEDEMDDLKEEVFKAVDGQGEEVDKGSFVIRSYKRPKYKFSDEYNSKNTELKSLRAAEIDNGTASIDGYSEFVKINFKKAKEA
jgi:hypothetical protein